jgi:hypothetical protein
MPNLSQSLPANDLGFIRIVASVWGLELASTEPVAAAVELGETLSDVELVEEVVSTLPKDVRAALEALAGGGGRMPWGTFTRRFGEVREMGAGKRDREAPHLHPKSAAEALWYRGLLARAFFDTEQGAQEFAFIPDDLLMALEFAGMVEPVASHAVPERTEKSTIEKKPEKIVVKLPVPVAGQKVPESEGEPLGRPASPAEKAAPIAGSDRLLDDACTLLAALRMGIRPAEMGIPTEVVQDFLSAAKIIVKGKPQPEPVKKFLEAPRPQALEMLSAAWQASPVFNELRQLPGLVCEGEWKNEPLVTREFLLELLEAIPEKQWWSVPAFVRDVKSKYPDYQRPAGDYDSWFIKREADGSYLRGFAHWDAVDGALLRYFIGGPLFWLGMVDLAAPEGQSAPAAFRIRDGDAPLSKPENGKVGVLSNGKITVPRLTPRAARYQIARFCEWEDEKEDGYPYRITPASLVRAREQGLKGEQLLGILQKHAAAPLPPPFVRALQRWEANGSEARLEKLVVLRLSTPEVLNELRASKAARFLGEILGPTTVIVKDGAQPKVLAALAEMGLMAEIVEGEGAEK